MKNKYRKLYKNIRDSISEYEKSFFDKCIFTGFINSELMNFDLYLVYVSFGSEINTINLINYLLNEGKKVAVPVCKDTNMDFFEIHSLCELKTGRYGILTVNENRTDKVVDFGNSLCIVPGVCFDNFGNRIGYGGGFYDRFLSNHSVTTVGLCYERCKSTLIPAEKHDRSVDYILSDFYLTKTKTKEVSVYE